MAVIEWRNEYNVGIREIDRQHRRIVDTLNELYDMQDAEKLPKQLQKVFGKLNDYITEHFTSEETYIEKHGCEGADEQKHEHELFIDTVCTYQRDFLKNKPLAVINLFNFVWDWFAHHIVVVDKKCLAGNRDVIH